MHRAELGYDDRSTLLLTSTASAGEGPATNVVRRRPYD